MVKRFNNLEDVYNTLVATNFDFNSLPSNNKYRKYKEWKQNPDQRKLPEGSAQNTGTRVAIALQPFGLEFDAASRVKLKMSGRVHSSLSSLGNAALYNHLAGDISAIQSNTGFVPAKAVLATKTGTRTVTASSNRITGRAYKTRTGETYTIPFGAGTATDREFAVQQEILTNRADTHVVTFVPERLYQV
jgi:hypothetical protein